MKKFAFILLGCALIMGMSQCKKDNTTNNERVRITLTADGGQNSKTVFNGAGSFTWKNGEKEYIYVGCSSHPGCIGKLTATGNGSSRVTFSGTLSPAPSTDDVLYFFYLGNGEHDGATKVNFGSQTGNLADVTNHHIAIGHAIYDGTGNYSATLDMAMAIAWFNTSEFTGSSIRLSGDGIYNEATINYQEGKITASKDGDIDLSTNGVSKNCYVALLPYSTGGPHTLTFTDGSSHSGSITFNSGIAAGDFYVSNPGSGATGLEVKPNNP